MFSLISTIFSDRDSYLEGHISKINTGNSFPKERRIGHAQLLSGVEYNSVLITGGTDEERTGCLLGILRSSRERTVILHNGNPYLTPERIRRCGIYAQEWDHDIYKNMNKKQILSLLEADDQNKDLISFFAYALEVCEVLGRTASIKSINDIDWLGIEWQQDLLNVVNQRERALDLLGRFDKNMAEKAIKGMCKIEKLSRGNNNVGTGLETLLSSGTILVKCVYGSNSQTTKQCFEALQAVAESGINFTLILDDIFAEEIPLIKDNYRNVRLVLSADDIAQYNQSLHITNRNCSIIVFRHPNYGSARIISETYFGEYDKFISEKNSGQSKTFFAQTTYNTSTTIRKGRELRLRPDYIVDLPRGCAFVHLLNGEEGVFVAHE